MTSRKGPSMDPRLLYELHVQPRRRQTFWNSLQEFLRKITVLKSKENFSRSALW